MLYVLLLIMTASSMVTVLSSFSVSGSGIVGNICNPLNFGAKGDNISDDTLALQSALNSPSCSIVQLSAPGLFLTRSLDLSNTSARGIVIDPNAALVVWRDRATWGNRNAFIFQSDASTSIDNFSISGGGSIIGGGFNWWPPTNESNKHLYFRPHAVFLTNVMNFSMTDMSIIDSPSCNIEVNGHHLYFARLTLAAAISECAQFSVAPNTGGFRLSGNDILVINSTVHNGDDCVPINPAPLNPNNATEGWGITENVVVSNVSCACGTNGPIIFSPGGTVRNVTFEMSVRDTFQGLGVKIATNSGPGSQPFGGLVTNITFRNITIRDPLNAAIYTDVFHQDVATCALPTPLPPDTSDWLSVQNISLQHIHATVFNQQAAGCFVCAPGDRKCSGWNFTNVTVVRQDGITPAVPYKCIYFRNATADDLSTPHPCGVGVDVGTATRGSSSSSREEGEMWVHPGVLLDTRQISIIKTALASGTEPFASAFAKVVTSSYANLSWIRQGPPISNVIECGGYDHPDHGCSAEDNDAVAAVTHALLFNLGEGIEHAHTAVRIMNAYASVIKYNNSNAPLQAAWSASKWSRAAELVLHGEGGGTDVWPIIESSAFMNFLVHTALPLIVNETNANGNWATSMQEGMLGIAVLTEDTILFNSALFFWRTRLPSYIYTTTDGPHPHPLPHRPGGQGPPNTQGWYGQTTFNASVNGVSQETCRDLEHTQMGLAAALNAAETARIQGIDLFAEESVRLIAGLEFHSSLLRGERAPAFVCHNGNVIDANITYPTFEIGYTRLSSSSSQQLPETLVHLELDVRTLPLPVNRWMMIWETLTHGSVVKA